MWIIDGTCILRDIEREGRCVRWIISGHNPISGKVFAINYKTDETGRGIYWQSSSGDWFCNVPPEKVSFDFKHIHTVRKRLAKYWERSGNPMATTEAQKRATAKYDAKNTTRVILKLNTTTDADILAKLEACGNKQGYIKALIRADLAK